MLQGTWVRGAVLSTVLALAAGGLSASPAVADDIACTIVGTNGPDVLHGTAADDVVCGLNGDDVLLGGEDNDVLEGGNGTDVLDGAGGDDVLRGGNGKDSLAGGPGNDALDGGNGKDSCDAGPSTVPTLFVDCEATSEDVIPEPEDPGADTDTDGLPAALEAVLGSSTQRADTDGDGLTDAEEFDTSTDPLTPDTDGDGVLDGADDTDGDGLANAAELAAGSDPARSDSDHDGLTDDAETTLGTRLANGDSDGDDLDDSQEVQLGTDPLSSDSDRDGTLDAAEHHDRTLTLDSASLTLTGSGPAVLAADLVANGDDRLVDVPGALGAPVEVRAADGLRGTLTLRFDPTQVGPDADVAVLHFDEETELFDRPADQSVDVAAGVATVTTDDFSPFLVVDLTTFADAVRQEVTLRGAVNPEPIDFGLLLDLSVTQDEDPVMWERHRAASHAVVDALRPGDRLMLHSYPWIDSIARFTQDPSGEGFTFSEDEAALHAAIDEAYATTYGSTYPLMGEQLTRLIDELEPGVDDGRATSIVAFGDGGGWTYPYGGMPTANAHAVPISVIAFEPLFLEDQVQEIADDSGRVLVKVAASSDAASVVRNFMGTAAARPYSDRDADGLLDVTETGGMPTTTGKVYRTDRNDADSDDDGLSDGEEMRAPVESTVVRGTTFAPYANPNRSDTDGDGLDDWYEVANVSRAFEADYDRDGLDDHAELVEHGLEPLSDDTDTDGLTDDWELAHATQGFDPDVYDVQYEWWEYAGDFSRGVLCGEADFWEFCRSDSWAFMAGALAAGFVGVGDVRDIVAETAKGDLIASGLVLLRVIPAAGDALSVADKFADMMRRSADKPGPALRFLGKSTATPNGVRIAALDAAFDGAATTLKGRGLDEDTILNFARRGMSPAHVVKVLDAATEVRTGVGRFVREIDAENLLRRQFTDARPDRPGVPIDADGALTKRFLDIFRPFARQGYEVKYGLVKASSRARRQLHADQSAVSLGKAGKVDQVAWHFYADRHGVLGPDEDLLIMLQSTSRPYVIHLP